MGKALAACTSATMRGSGASVVISHPAAVFCIQTPTFATRVAVHTTAKARRRNGLNDDTGDNINGRSSLLVGSPPPGAAFGLVDPDFDVAGAGDVAAAIAQVVGLAESSCEGLVVLS